MGTCIVINHFRTNILKLAPLTDNQALSMMKNVPHTYCWSPSLVAKPGDWGPHIDVCGYFFLSSTVNYEPSQDLLDFLANGARPLYIGFGSIVGFDQTRLFKIVRDALKETGRRAVVSDKLATLKDKLPDNMFRLGDCPHEWLFKQGMYDLSSVKNPVNNNYPTVFDFKSDTITILLYSNVA
jgi:UDP:flavonoid glycosyltransferase YjiC (YdhE family)